jgi:hypothetical protein
MAYKDAVRRASLPTGLCVSTIWYVRLEPKLVLIGWVSIFFSIPGPWKNAVIRVSTIY